MIKLIYICANYKEITDGCCCLKKVISKLNNYESFFL